MVKVTGSTSSAFTRSYRECASEQRVHFSWNYVLAIESAYLSELCVMAMAIENVHLPELYIGY